MPNTANTLQEHKSEIDKHLADLRRDMDALIATEASIKEIHDDVKAMKELLTAWNSAKGFVTTVRVIGTGIRWTMYLGGTIGAIWYFVKFGRMPPN